MMFYPMARAKYTRSLPYSKKMAKHKIFGALIMARSARGSARAPIKNFRFENFN